MTLKVFPKGPKYFENFDGIFRKEEDLEIGGVMGENWPRWATWVCRVVTLAIILLGLSIILKCVGV